MTRSRRTLLLDPVQEGISCDWLPTRDVQDVWSLHPGRDAARQALVPGIVLVLYRWHEGVAPDGAHQRGGTPRRRLPRCLHQEASCKRMPVRAVRWSASC